MAPEVLRQNGNGVYPAKRSSELPLTSFPVDVWATGVLAYELITSVTPFEYALPAMSKLYNAIIFKEPTFAEK